MPKMTRHDVIEQLRRADEKAKQARQRMIDKLLAANRAEQSNQRRRDGRPLPINNPTDQAARPTSPEEAHRVMVERQLRLNRETQRGPKGKI